VFRNQDGTPSGKPGIRLQLQDFANEELVEDVRTEDREICISSEKLCLYLENAEKYDRGPRPSPRSKHTIRPGAVKRLRSETPPATLTSDDEARYQREEDRTAKRTVLNDPEYVPSSVSGSFSD
jgi:hypothetical protein